MSKEFQGGVCGRSLWNSSTNLFRSLPINTTGIFCGWPTSHDDMMNTKKSCEQDSGSSSVVLDDDDSTLQIMDINLPSSAITNPTSNWNQEFPIDNGRSDENYSHLLNSSMNYGQENGFIGCTQSNKEWSFNNLCEDSSITNYSVEHEVNQSLISSFPASNSASFSCYNSLPHESLLDYNQMINSHDFSTTFPKASSPMIIKPSLHFTNNTAFWNAKDECLSTQFQSSLSEETSEIGSVSKKDKKEPLVKRQRMDHTPSPLPTFKVRKEKMGDRVTALQQLVSPFGKTDTASVLHEAIEYIQFLHDQVSVLSNSYVRNGSQHEIKDQEGLKVQDLKSRGLCLVPHRAAFRVTSETSTDFWTP